MKAILIVAALFIGFSADAQDYVIKSQWSEDADGNITDILDVKSLGERFVVEGESLAIASYEWTITDITTSDNTRYIEYTCEGNKKYTKIIFDTEDMLLLREEYIGDLNDGELFVSYYYELVKP